MPFAGRRVCERKASFQDDPGSDQSQLWALCRADYLFLTFGYPVTPGEPFSLLTLAVQHSTSKRDEGLLYCTQGQRKASTEYSKPWRRK
jgi:hypothetical protein